MNRAKQTAGLLALLLLLASGNAQAQDRSCAGAEDRFEAALQQKDFKKAKAIEEEIAVSALCGGQLTRYRARRIGREIEVAESLRSDPSRRAEREALIMDADHYRLLWTAAYLAGELFMKQRRYAEAAEAFERAVTISGDAALTPSPPSSKDWRELRDLAYSAKALAAGFVSSGHDHRGNIAGTLGQPANRALEVKVTPLPVQFETDSANLTDVGRQYAEELAQAIREQHPLVVTLEGHTDERGGDAYNMDLSRRRVETVAAFLKSRGVGARIATEAKGKREPFTPADASGFTKEQIWALNRRVVWRRPD